MLHNVLEAVESKNAIKAILAHQNQAFRLASGAVLQPGTPEHSGFVEGLKVAAMIVGAEPIQ